MKKKVLVIVHTDLSDHNSASLCHGAYIRGLVDSQNSVTVISVTPTSGKYDYWIEGVNYIFVSDENIIIKYERNKRKNNELLQLPKISQSNQGNSEFSLKSMLKNVAIKCFGATKTWKRRVLRLHLSETYDVVLSLSSPPTSHEITSELLKKKKIYATNWCQIWEDPWSTDLYNIDKSIELRENKILTDAQKVLYVTPLTLENQMKLFPKNANKMGWLPLPTYYEGKGTIKRHENLKYGYFGQYYPNVRNLRPTYEALNVLKRDFTICGDPDNLFGKTETTHIYPRVSLEELKKFEQDTDVLVFVCNLGGGQIPGKIYQYSGTDKWILFVLDGNVHEKIIIKNYFSQFNRYVFCNNNCDEIIQAIKRIEHGGMVNIRNDRVEYFSANIIATEIVKFAEQNLGNNLCLYI